MRKRIHFSSGEEIIIFKNSLVDNEFYGMTKEVLTEKMIITEKYGGDEKKVPDNYRINVYPFRFNKHINSFTDEYIVNKNEIIEIPINQIEWVWIQIIDNESHNKIMKELEDLLNNQLNE